MTGGGAPKQVRGFTLLELLVVVAIMGLVAAMVTVGIAQSAGTSRQRDAVNAIADVLLTQRLEAMRAQADVECTLAAREDELVLRAGKVDRAWRGSGLVPVAEAAPVVPEPGLKRPVVAARAAGLDLRHAAALKAKFDSRGRTRERRWDLAGPEDKDRKRTIWTIRFDPVSGVPMVERAAAVTRG